ncbi:hypothetical protein ABZT48_17385 [Streptomyces avermitilis]|uniref:hypothetical protein n=1 Tax=Streptomyces avermitilis TaxID=33903 RepID=UPI0033AE177A
MRTLTAAIPGRPGPVIAPSEVTRDDVLTHLETLQGSQRQHTIVALRPLFSRAKKNGTIFKSPTSRIRVGRREDGGIQPLEPEHNNGSIAAVTHPADRLILALAAVHAARSAAIRRLQLDDLDIGNRRPTVDGRTRRLDELTLQVAWEWLEFRRHRWPDTADPYLLINKHTAPGTGPIGRETFWGLRWGVTSIERTAYPPFKRLITTHELHPFFSPTRDELQWAPDATNCDEHLPALLLMLKSYQRMGCSPKLEDARSGGFCDRVVRGA